MTPTYKEVLDLWKQLRMGEDPTWWNWPRVADITWFPNRPEIVRIWEDDRVAIRLVYPRNPDRERVDENFVYLDMRARRIVELNGDRDALGEDEPWRDHWVILVRTMADQWADLTIDAAARLPK